MSSRGEEWFWHLLALNIGGRTVSELKSAMSYKEFHYWMEFYKQNPFDDLNRIVKPTALIYSALGGKPEKAIEYLHKEMNEEDIDSEFSEADLSIIKNLRGAV
jgi:hypothetical protein